MYTDTDVLIIGTGFSGLGMSIKLMQAGLTNFTVLEQADEVGGTWRDNHYPGVACDVPSHLYSYSFEANPRWSRLFAPQREIFDYLKQCADKYGVRPHIHFNSEVVKAVFDERRGMWDVTTRAGKLYRARVLVSGSGGLSRPSFPEIPGRDRFKGKTFHTARWDHDYPLAGKRVAVIGTGASAIQVVPGIVDKVGHLTLFQRTPAWVLPKPNFRMDAKAQERFEKNPWLQRMMRNGIYWLMESRALGFTGMVPGMQDNTEVTARKFLAKQVKDPVLRAKLTPNYRPGCKRMLISNSYYAALQKPNASVETSGIKEITERGIITQDGKLHELDVIVYATGFQAAEAVAPFEVRGRDGLDLNDAWRDGAEAYKGTTVAGFPNFFLLMGPNTGLGHNSMVFMIESQIQYVFDSLKQMRASGTDWLDVKPSAQKLYNQKLTERLSKTVWATGGCVSWYQTKTGKNTTLWPGFTFEYRLRTRKFDLNNYELHKLEARPRARPKAQPELQAQAPHPAE